MEISLLAYHPERTWSRPINIWKLMLHINISRISIKIITNSVLKLRLIVGKYENMIYSNNQKEGMKGGINEYRTYRNEMGK